LKINSITGKYFVKISSLLRRWRSVLQDSSIKQYHCRGTAGCKFTGNTLLMGFWVGPYKMRIKSQKMQNPGT
jgi:hypothetical protein